MMALKRALARRLRKVYSIAYDLLLVRPTLGKSVDVKMLGFNLVVPPSVFHPKHYFSSAFLAEYVQSLDIRGATVLDAGCGSGILALAAARAGAKVTAIDINQAAVEATKENARSNGLHKDIRVLLLDIRELRRNELGVFNYIVTNPPFYTRQPQSLSESAFMGGASNEFMSALANAAASLLDDGGSIHAVLSSDVPHARILQPLEELGFQTRIVRTQRQLFERLSILQLRR